MCLQNGSEETAFLTESVAALILEHGEYGTLSKICCNFACPFDDTAEQSTSVGMGAWQRRDNPLGLRGECRSAALTRPQTNMQSLAAKGQIGIKVGAIYLVQQDMSQQSPSSTKSIVDGDRATGPHVQAERLKGSVRVPNARPHCSVTISTSPWHRDNCS